jgi:menaquinone-dependent protoporphyrinogen oxidase
MKPVLIAYATREGHTRDVADRVAVTLNELGRPAVLLDVQQLDRAIVLEDFSGAILAASVHAGAHEDAMVDFVKTNRDALAVRPTAFLSVSLTEATAEDPDRTAEERAEAAGTVEETVEKFLDETGWRPTAVQPVAGALLYTRYGRVLRWMMRRIARDAGGDADTSTDHVYTDWEALGHFVRAFLDQLPDDGSGVTDPNEEGGA